MSSLPIDGLSVLTSRLPAGARLPWHDHGKATLCVVYAGLLAEEDGCGSRERSPGDLVWRSQPERHRNLAMAASEVLVVEVDPAALAVLRDLGLPTQGARFVRTARTVTLARQLRPLLARQTPERPLEVLGRLLELMGELVRTDAVRQQQPPGWLLRVRARLHDVGVEPLALGELMRLVEG